MKPICANCGIEIHWQPTIVNGCSYCCLGCAQGGPCTCDYSNLPRIGESRAIVRHSSVIILPPPGQGQGKEGEEQGGSSVTGELLAQ